MIINKIIGKKALYLGKVKTDRMIGAKDTIGYALGDAGGQLTFGLVGVFLTMFYTDILGITTTQIAVLMFVARLWDGISDPIWGYLIDHIKPSKFGRFRPWLFWGSFPLAVTAVILFADPGLGSQRWNLVWAYFGFIAYDIAYTVVNISYGALASVVSPLESDRASLSTFRSAGAGVGALPGAVILPLIVFSRDALGNSYLNSRSLFLSVIGLAALSLLVLLASFLMTKERVPPKAAQNLQLRKTLGALIRNRPFIMLCITSMLLIGMQMYIAPINSYLFKDYFNQPEMIAMYSLFTYMPMALALPVMGKLVRRFGKKELCAAGLLFGALVFAAMFFIQTQNIFVYLALCFLSGVGMTFLIMQIWALVTDTIDFHFLLSGGQREEGTVYALFAFTRKLGQTAAGTGSALLLGMVGYDGLQAVQTAETVSGLYTLATLVPAIAMGLMFLVLTFGYPLNKAQLQEMRAELDLTAEVNHNSVQHSIEETQLSTD